MNQIEQIPALSHLSQARIFDTDNLSLIELASYSNIKTRRLARYIASKFDQSLRVEETPTFVSVGID